MRTVWLDNECQRVIKEKRLTRLKWLGMNNSRDSEDYKKIRKQEIAQTIKSKTCRNGL